MVPKRLTRAQVASIFASMADQKMKTGDKWASSMASLIALAFLDEEAFVDTSHNWARDAVATAITVLPMEKRADFMKRYWGIDAETEDDLLSEFEDVDLPLV